MNQQRWDAYLNLIQQLLSCTNGKEGEILRENQDLLDAKFLQVMEAVARVMSEEGNEDTANYLRNLGNKLVEGFNLSYNLPYTTQKNEITQSVIDTYLGFLLEVLQAMEESKGNKDVLYPLLIANTDKLDNKFAEILWRWCTVTLILERDSKTIFPPNIVTQIEQLRDEIAKGQYKIQNSTSENPTALAQQLQELRQQKKNLEDKYLPVGSGFSFKEFQKKLDRNKAVIEWYITNTGLETFIITSDNLQRFNSSTSTGNLKAFTDWNFNYLDAYYSNKDEWKDNLFSRLNQLAQILNIEEILQLVPNNCSHLTLIPHRYLHLLPLHALPLSDSSFLCDKFADGVSYAPSCQLLQQLNLRQRVDFNSLFAIQNPTEDLDYTDLEVETISSLFTDKEILSKKQATQTALSQASSQIQQANYLHFSCHGTFNLETPQNSCLLLAGADENDKLDLKKCLTLGKLFERDFNLSQCRLVVLSACETGLIDFQNTSDEYIGLPSGFLYAGSSSVVSSLWTVNDLSTSFLMIKFIQNLKNIENISVPVALNQAQTWLREATKEDLQEWTSNLQLNNLRQVQLMLFFKQIEANSKPFQSPFYWAAFTAVGN
ncbi:hypothetical protein Riv7116_0865 [Rivularia sp. PCC 7116]|uniref:CHAT domain-containing protein n=1 Tax=Rivularia sp. PCC 7116 TaxID=373994 RepID=UPI00029ECC19|nr:CHAT domain-containing protein [Rivularia sp. PCC 7116]AFY53446.1 hypothetical protein Riv7116_0865 [Rivularia sp. PCC 7116]